MARTNDTDRGRFQGGESLSLVRALHLRAVGVTCGLVLSLFLGSGCAIPPGSCFQGSQPPRPPNPDIGFRYYQEEALRLMTASGRHSELALQYTGKAVGRPDAHLWRDLAEAHVLLATYELNVATIMAAIALTHWQLEHGPTLSWKQEGAP